METVSLDSSEKRACVRQLNRLIAACKDDVFVNDAAARAVHDPVGRARLKERSRRRESFVDDLRELVLSLDGRSSGYGSWLVSTRGAIHRLRAAVVGDNDGDEYGACSRVAMKTEEVYAKTLETQLPDSVRAVVERQHAEVERDRDELRRLEFER